MENVLWKDLWKYVFWQWSWPIWSSKQGFVQFPSFGLIFSPARYISWQYLRFAVRFLYNNTYVTGKHLNCCLFSHYILVLLNFLFHPQLLLYHVCPVNLYLCYFVLNVCIWIFRKPGFCFLFICPFYIEQSLKTNYLHFIF